MDAADVERAVKAARSTVMALGLDVDDATVLHNSNRIAVRLCPCRVVARVAPLPHRSSAEFEVGVARHLAGAGTVAGLDPRVEPRVYVHDDFAITLWTYFESAGRSPITPAEYSLSLANLHVSLRRTRIRAPRFTDRVAEAQSLVADRAETPELASGDRRLLADTLGSLGSTVSSGSRHEQLLHGEPHLGNLLRTAHGLLFIDLETCCRGPIEFDIAHGLLPADDPQPLRADEVCEHYPQANLVLVHHCRALVWAMITTWRWRTHDQLPNRTYWRTEGLTQLRTALGRLT